MAEKKKKTTKKKGTGKRTYIKGDVANAPKEAAEEVGEAPKKRGRPKKEVPFIKAPEGRVENIPLAHIDLEDEKFRFRVNLRVGKLAASIQERGQQLPVLLRRPPGSGKLQIISGFRRIAAIQKVGWDTVSAIVRDDLDDDATACQVSIIENELRQTYNDLDRAYAILAYRSMGKSNAEVQDVFKVGERQRQRLEKLTTFPEVLQEAVAEDHVSSTNAVRLMQHAAKYPKTDLDGWIQEIHDKDMTFAELNKALKEAVAEAKEEAPIEFFVEREKDGEKSLRIRPIAVDSSMTAEQRKKLVADLKAVVEFVEGM